MLKTAFELGIKLAYEEGGVTPEQMTAAKRIGGVGGGITGASLGGLLGNYLGGRAAKSLNSGSLLFNDVDPEMAKTVGSGLGALLGGGLGGFVGSQIPQWKYQEKGAPQEESALGALPIAYSQEPYLGLNYGNNAGYYDDYNDYGGGGNGYY